MRHWNINKDVSCDIKWECRGRVVTKMIIIEDMPRGGAVYIAILCICITKKSPDTLTLSR